MNMTGFERLMRTLRGLATAYSIYMMVDKDGVYVYHPRAVSYGMEGTKVPPEAIENEIVFEEFIKEFIKGIKNEKSN